MTPSQNLPPHTHNGTDSTLISTSNFVKITGAVPTWNGHQGEMVFLDTGATYSIYVWLNGAWRNFPYTP